ncbi:hypothetical protein PTKIN_Ptkin19aG0060000 [Pterospermum kingtungense]
MFPEPYRYHKWPGSALTRLRMRRDEDTRFEGGPHLQECNTVADKLAKEGVHRSTDFLAVVMVLYFVLKLFGAHHLFVSLPQRPLFQNCVGIWVPCSVRCFWVSLTCDVQVPYSGNDRALYSKPVRFRQQGTQSPRSFSTFFSFSITNLNGSTVPPSAVV